MLTRCAQVLLVLGMLWTPAIAMLLGLEPTLIMAAVLLTTTLAPVVSPFIAEFIAGAAVLYGFAGQLTDLVFGG